MTTVLVTGAGGQLGRELVDVFDGLDVVAAGHDRLDVADRDAVVGAITSLRPDVVVHAAAWTAVDACEADPDRAAAVNALGTRHVADGARRVGAHVVYVSTDYVFDGTKDGPYDEWDATAPTSVYGRTKLGGELELDPGWTTVRTSWVFGRHGANFVKTVLGLAGQGGELRMVDDQRGCPTSAADLAATIRLLAVGRRPGTFHVTNQGATTWCQLARDILVLAGGDPARVVPIGSADLDRPAPRPANSVLDNAALRLSGIAVPPDHHDPLERLVKELTS
ncbi:MAG: dTDP-4-dehydrorhamnose reductase [Actinomycetia bacterium]|nr:dTDP-4-dehydrorhamnose reductase [Actinomycetes bacterium]